MRGTFVAQQGDQGGRSGASQKTQKVPHTLYEARTHVCKQQYRVCTECDVIRVIFKTIPNKQFISRTESSS